MKILHISNDFSLTKVHKNLYKALDGLGVDQTIFNPVRNTTPVGNNDIEFECKSSKIIYSEKIKKYHRFLFSKKISFLYKDLNAKINLSEVQLSHATTLFSDGAIAYEIKKKQGIPYLVAIRATDIDVFLKYRPDLIFIAIRIIKEAEKIIFIGDSLKKRFLNHTLIKRYKHLIETKSEIIHNGIADIWLDNIVPKKTNLPFKVLYVGRFVGRKNVPNLIKAILELNNSGYNLEINLVGSGGIDEPKIKELSDNNSNNVKVLGQIMDIDALRKIYRENHIFAMPSKGETFGLVYIEALSQGLPLLYSHNEGIDGVFDFNFGEKCKDFDVNEISNCLKKILNNYNSYDLNKIDFSIFRWNNIALRYFTIYKNLCEK